MRAGSHLPRQQGICLACQRSSCICKRRDSRLSGTSGAGTHNITEINLRSCAGTSYSGRDHHGRFGAGDQSGGDYSCN